MNRSPKGVSPMPLTFILQEEGVSCLGRLFCGVFFGTWWFLDVSGELVEGIHAAPFDWDAFVFLLEAKPWSTAHATL